jgi:NAD-dependent deacetylase
MSSRVVTTEASAAVSRAASLIRQARHLTAFTGAGISVESGIPPFRGEGGLWTKYDPRMLEIRFFLERPEAAWPVLKEIFYNHFGAARPNRAHEVLAAWEARGLLKTVITQNIDNMHFEAGSRNVIEYHGNSRTLVCLACREHRPATPEALAVLPPRCPCGGSLKPDMVFFGEGIPCAAADGADAAAEATDCMLVVGSTGEVYPAARVPRRARERGAAIVEINPVPSEFTGIVDVRIPLGAAEALGLLEKELNG